MLMHHELWIIILSCGSIDLKITTTTLNMDKDGNKTLTAAQTLTRSNPKKIKKWFGWSWAYFQKFKNYQIKTFFKYGF